MESGFIPPVWTWFPGTMLVAAFAVSIHMTPSLDAKADRVRHDWP